MSARLRLRRHDGAIYLDRWGFEIQRWGGVFLHKMSAGDPGLDLHDHPWWFGSLVLSGGYVEEKVESRSAPARAALVESCPSLPFTRGRRELRRRWSWKTMRLDHCHRITNLTAAHCWTLVVHGPWRRPWGFFLPTGWVDDRTYDETVRVHRRDLWEEVER